jgi:acyl-CoA thioester hydrolase
MTIDTAPRTFRHRIRVPYADVDRMGFVYYANYLVYFEMARSEMLREAGLPYSELEKRGIWLPVVSAHCDYKKPAHYEDLLLVLTRCSTENNVRLHIAYEVRRAGTATSVATANDGGELLMTGATEHVCLSPAGKVLRLTPELKALAG